MEPIISRTSTERLIRVGIFMVLVDVFTVLYLWDGYVGYAQQNRAALAKALGVESVDPPLTVLSDAKRELAILHTRDPIPKLTLNVGEPHVVHQGDLYYLGEGGWLFVDIERDMVDSVTWVDGPHTESDIRWQRYIGYTLGVVGIFATLFFGRVLATRAVLNDDGLQLTGKPRVRWDDIRGLRADPHKRGVIELEYEANGSRRTLRMDDYLYKDLARITAAIAAKKGLHDPLAALQKT